MFSLGSAIEKHVVPWTEVDWPVDWGTVFGRERSLRLELGFGNGEYLERVAGARPDVNWVGVELSWFSVVRLLKRLHRTGMDNVRVLHGDGALLLERLFPVESLDEVVLNHSDPWPKKRRHFRRLVQPRLLEHLGDRLRPGGKVLIVTDHQGYAEWITDVLTGQPTLHSMFPTPWVDHLSGHPTTKYSRKGLDAGLTIHYFLWAKTGPTRGGLDPDTVDTMTQILLGGEAYFSGLLSGFGERTIHETHRNERILLKFGKPYLRGDGGEWLVDVRVQDGPFAQHVLLSVIRLDPDRLLLKPSSVGAPRRTWGVKRALWHLATHFLESWPGLTVHSTGVAGVLRTPTS